MSRDSDIDKIDEQIKMLQNGSDIKEKVDKKNTVDKPVEELLFDDEDDHTKVVSKIDEIEEDDSNIEVENSNEVSTDEVVEEKEETIEAKKEKIDNNNETENVYNKEEASVTSDIKSDNKKNKPKKKNRIIILLIVGIVCLFIIMLVVILLFKKNRTSVDSKKYTASEQKKIVNGYGDALKTIIALYYDKKEVILEYDEAIKLVKYDYDVDCNTHEIYEDGSIYLSKCSIDDVKTNATYGKKQKSKEKPTISEDAIKIYVSKSTGKATLKDPKNEKDYDVYGVKIDGEYIELSLLDEKSDYLYYILNPNSDYIGTLVNFKTGKKALEGVNYYSIHPIMYDDKYDSTYVAVVSKGEYSWNKDISYWGIYNVEKNLRIVSPQYSSIGPFLGYGTSGPRPYVEALEKNKIAVANYDSSYGAKYGVIDYTNGSKIISQNYKLMHKSGQYLWAIDSNDRGHIFNYSGSEFLNGKYDKILWVVDGKYVLVKNGNSIKLVNLDGKELYSYGNYDIDSVNFGTSYNNGALFQTTNPAIKNPDYDGKKDCLEFIYNGESKKGEVKEEICGGIAKPILYLYPKKTTKVTVSFDHPEYLKTTYPKFIDKWEVTANSNGDLYDKDNKYYYGLYWDEYKVHSVDFSEGFYVDSNDSIKFLEEKLKIIGLSDREANEFIMYWLPIMEENGNNLVYFELTDERESYNKINISPKPDSLLRLVIHIKKVDNKIKIKEQKLNSFNRKGFVAVEWGGTTY